MLPAAAGSSSAFFGIAGVDKDIDMGADRIAGDQPAREHARRQRQAADLDLIALDILAAGAIAIADDRRGVVQIVRDMRRRLFDFGGGDNAFDPVPVAGRLHPLPRSNQIVDQAGEIQQANARGNLRPEQLVSIEHLISRA